MSSKVAWYQNLKEVLWLSCLYSSSICRRLLLWRQWSFSMAERCLVPFRSSHSRITLRAMPVMIIWLHFWKAIGWILWTAANMKYSRGSKIKAGNWTRPNFAVLLFGLPHKVMVMFFNCGFVESTVYQQRMTDTLHICNRCQLQLAFHLYVFHSVPDEEVIVDIESIDELNGIMQSPARFSQAFSSINAIRTSSSGMPTSIQLLPGVSKAIQEVCVLFDSLKF